MLKYLIVDLNKGIAQATAASAMTRGAISDDGEFFADKERNYDGINAAIEQKESAFETIASGELYNKVPTRVGEEYATTELTPTSLSAGDYLKPSSGKLIKASSGAAIWQYVGTYSNPYGVTMYRVRRVPTHTVG